MISIRPVLACSLLVGCLGASSLTACRAPDPADEPLVAPLVEPGSPEEAGMLAFVHDPATTFELLDEDVGLDVRAARNIMDERPFESIDELDAVPYVGTVALQKILDWAREHGFVEAAGEVDRDGATLALVNHEDTTFALLDVDVALDRRAAENIIAARADGPFASIAQLDAVPYVGASALDKLATYAVANGYAPAPTGGVAPSCVIVSEYVEGQGNNNKAIEIYNCGAEPVSLDQVGVCLVRNDDTTCSNSAGVGGGTLAPGGVRVLCRTRAGTFNDPLESLRAACEFEIGGVATFNGDDRLVLFHDEDADGARGASEPALDTFGDPATRPSDVIWAETNLRRCDLTPRPSGAFDAADVFTAHPRHDHGHLGVAPPLDCGAVAIGGEGDACQGHDSCAEGLRCFGIPFDGSSDTGKCVDLTPIPGEGATCDRHTPCAEGLICAGWTLWGEGSCNPQWMAGRWSADPEWPVHDAPSGGLASSVVVTGLASVPVDIEVTVHLTHPRPSDLRVTLLDPQGTESVLWDRSEELTDWSRSYALNGISRDDNVNGRWQLRVQDMVTGESGTLHGWTLFLTSRWD